MPTVGSVTEQREVAERTPRGRWLRVGRAATRRVARPRARDPAGVFRRTRARRWTHLFADAVIVVRRMETGTPTCFLLTPTEVKDLVHRGEKEGRISYWLQPQAYESEEFRERWDKVGVLECAPDSEASSG